jgi:hypothetical protein
LRFFDASRQFIFREDRLAKRRQALILQRFYKE